jgi:O-antigen/teichoic acid export membrane protein
MSQPRLNLLANYIGTGWSALMGFAFIPIYVRLMGTEAFGLVGFFATLQALLQMLDLGLSPTMNREMARYRADPSKSSEARSFVRTLEIGYWAIGVIIGLCLIAAAPLVATRWIKATLLPVSAVEHALMAMGVLAALQWPLSFYQGGLLGLQRQVLLNSVQVVMSTLINGGAVLILWLVSPTLMAFFTWRIAMAVVQVALTTGLLWRSLPESDAPPTFQRALLLKSWRFAAGMSGIGLSGLILSQLDKVVVSGLLTLEQFGYYSLAGVVVAAIAMVAGPIFNVTFPMFSALVAVGSDDALVRLYHRSCQLMTVFVLPVAAVVAFFSFDLFRLWTGSADTARHVAPIASVLVIGSALNALMVGPYALQLAHGWTSLGVRVNLVLILMLIPALYVLVTKYGAVGAAGGWVLSQAIYVLLAAPLTHRRLLKGEGGRWLLRDVGLPLAVAVLTAGAGRRLLGGLDASSMPGGVAPAIVLLAALTAAALVAPEMRSLVVGQWQRKF